MRCASSRLAPSRSQWHPDVVEEAPPRPAGDGPRALRGACGCAHGGAARGGAGLALLVLAGIRRAWRRRAARAPCRNLVVALSLALLAPLAVGCSDGASRAPDGPAAPDAAGDGGGALDDAGAAEGGAPVADGAAEGGSPEADGAPAATCPPTSPGDVGPTDPSLLTWSDRVVVSASGAVIENVDVHGDIEIVDGATDVTIRNFRVTTDGWWGIFIRDGANVVIEDGEIDGMNLVDDGIRGGSYTARRLYVHNMEGDAFKADGDNVIECNYVTAIGQGDGAHGDGVQMMGDGDIWIRRNNFDLTSGSLTACIFPFGQDPVGGPVWVEENRLTGGAYIVYCHTNLHVTGNAFGPDYAYGPVTGECGTWADNVWETTGEAIPN